MPITIKTGVMKYKDQNGNYNGFNAIAQEGTEEQLAQITAKGQEVLESIPEDYTELSGDVGELKSAINDIYDENRKRISPVWEHGYIDTSTGADKYNGSTTLSRTDYIKASELSYYHNPYAKDSYVFYYTKSGDVYTYANINKYVRNAWHFINPYGDYYVRIAFYGGFDDAKDCEFFSKETNLRYAEKEFPLLKDLVNSQYLYTKITPNIDSNYQNCFLSTTGNATGNALYSNLFDVSEAIPIGDEDAIMYPYDMIIDGCYIGFYSGTNLNTMVKMIQGECKAGTVVAIPTGANYFRITVKKTDEFACYKVKLTDTSLTLPNKSADSKAVGIAINGLPGLEEDNAKIVIRNLVNPSEIVPGHYMYPEHTEYSENSLYQATGYMNVIPGNTYYFYTGTTSKTCYFVAVYDSYKNPVIGKGGSNMSSYTVTDGEAYIICSFATTDTNLCVITESSLSEYIEYGVIKISKDVLPDSQTGEDKPNYLSGATYLSDIKQALKKNVVVTYFATFSAFTSLKIGFTQTDDYTTGYTNYFEITDTNFIMHRKNASDQSWAHGMTIADYIGVTLSFDKDKHCTVDVITNGGAYTKENTIFEGWKYYPFAVLSGTSVANEKLSMACKDFRKNVLLFGDSYFGYSTKGWMYYLGDEVYENLCVNGLAGESSTGAFTDLNVLRNFASPKYIVWCLGMNDGSDTNDTTPNAAWLSNEQSFISYCESHGIIPVLATIPSVPAAGSRPARNHKGKSAWVRASGYKYIDFAKAVENPDYDPQTDDPIDMWYSGMLNAGTEQSPDLMHPDVEGAKALCARAITDFPQLLVPSD